MSKKTTYLREQRDRALFEAYCKAIAERDFVSQRPQDEAIDYVRTHEAPRFYISPEFCMLIMGRMSRGQDSGIKGKAATRKFQELFRRYVAEWKKPESRDMDIYDICCKIVCQPAPEFYINNRAARGIIQRQKKLRQEEWERKRAK